MEQSTERVDGTYSRLKKLKVVERSKSKARYEISNHTISLLDLL